MRQARLKVGECAEVGYYHCVSRVVNRDFLFGDGEKEKFVELMRLYERFHQVRVVTYCVMSNHFHVLVEVTKRPSEEMSDEALIALLEECGLDWTGMGPIRGVWERWMKVGATEAWSELKESYLKRMWDVSYFMKSLKQRFTQWYNKEHGHKGTLWEARFKSVLVEGCGEALATMSAYIDLNPVRAGIVEDSEEYRWCGYAAAVAGVKEAVEGLCVIGRFLGNTANGGVKEGDEAEMLAMYRKLVFLGAEERGIKEDGTPMRRGVSREKIREVVEKGGKLSKAEMLRCRVRYFCDGAVFGTKEFVNQVFRQERWRFGEKRKDGARKVRVSQEEGMFVLRDLKVNVVG